jgi:hypothetical protein
MCLHHVPRDRCPFHLSVQEIGQHGELCKLGQFIPPACITWHTGKMYRASRKFRAWKRRSQSTLLNGKQVFAFLPFSPVGGFRVFTRFFIGSETVLYGTYPRQIFISRALQWATEHPPHTQLVLASLTKMAKNYSTSVQLLVMVLLVLMFFANEILGRSGPSTCVDNRKFFLNNETREFLSNDYVL